ncbi:hypothetical protein ASPTUDRAFT_283616 [Aspergillus tubingensis CBS 134.48]|uniref:Uncharacterized protein n=1 Tax=Aspergillus tubingensis (strain CBS 134.48) TaxID=767770 RepID=A0A1L9NNZ5_ASPTC|nr:hypothetical protein ASPTUDRAFT_283616 [Aspergillus tubingensis CBS 134.48]
MKLMIPATARSFNQSNSGSRDKQQPQCLPFSIASPRSRTRSLDSMQPLPNFTDRTHRMPGSYPSFPLSTNGGSSMICMAGQEVPDYRTIEHGPPLATDYLRGHSHPVQYPTEKHNSNAPMSATPRSYRSPLGEIVTMMVVCCSWLCSAAPVPRGFSFPCGTNKTALVSCWPLLST